MLFRSTDPIEGISLDAGKMVLSPTRTYAPVVKKLLDALRTEIHGMVHCSGGAQTKVLHFVDNVRVIKDNLFPVPPLFKTIKEQSGTDWSEMYRCLIWAIAWKYIFHLNMQKKLLQFPSHSELTRKSLDALKNLKKKS